MAQVLSAATGQPYGHERLFGTNGFRPELLPDYCGDVSWMAVPYLPQLDGNEWDVWHVVRHPDLVLCSLRGIGFFQHPEGRADFFEWAVSHLSYPFAFIATTKGSQEALFYCLWNEMIELWVPPERRIKVEGVTPEVVAQIVGDAELVEGWQQAVAAVPKDYNSREREPVDYNFVEKSVLENLAVMRERFGYA